MQFANLYAWTLLLTAVLTSLALPYVWERRFSPGARPILVLLAGVVVWCFGYGWELFNTQVGAMLLWIRIEYLGTVSVPTAWLLYALEFSGRVRWLHRRTVQWFFILPVLILVMVWTVDLHPLYYHSVGTVTLDGLIYLDFERGPFYWVNVVYSYLAFLAATIILLHALVRDPETYRGQVGALLVGALAPWAANILYLAGLMHADPTPLGFAVSGLAVAISLKRFQLFGTVPQARDWLIENLQEPVLVLNLQGEVIDANRAARAFYTTRRLPASSPELVGRMGVELFRIIDIDLQPYLNQQEHRVEVNVGAVAPHWYEMHVRPLVEKAGAPVAGWVINARDIQKRKLADQALEETRDRALQASLAKSQFIASVNHELNLPMASLLEAGSILLTNPEDPLQPHQRAVVEGIYQSIQQIRQTLNDLADHPITRDGKVQLFVSQFTPSKLVGRLRGMFAEPAKQKGLALDLMVEPGFNSLLVGDANRIEQILAELLDNAIKYTSAGSVTLRIYQPDASCWAAEVRDSGSGIDPAMLLTLTQGWVAPVSGPPAQTPAAASEHAGLGLAMVRQLALLMKARIEVNSRPGKGTTVNIFFPLITPVTERQSHAVG